MVRGPVARIYYGQSGMRTASVIDPNKILLRKQVILEPNHISTNEYEPNSLLQLVNRYLASDPNTITNGNIANKWIARPIDINSTNAGSIAMYLAKDVNDFSITFCSRNDIDLVKGFLQWRKAVAGQKIFFSFWPRYPYFKQYPDMIKFTFTLYDSKKILKNGRRFEHIVYIGQ